LCIAVVAGTAVYVTTRNATSQQPEYEARNINPDEQGNDNAVAGSGDQLNAQQPEDTQASAAGNQSEIGSPASVTGGEGNSAVQPADESAAKPKPTEAPSKSTAPKSAAPAKKQSFIMPVTGGVSLEYAKDTLVYSKTMEDWRAHTGIDLASDRGTPVKAVAEGVVVDVRNDQYYGITIVVDHGNDLKTVYRNLAADDSVSVNQKVKQGEVIGSVGNTATDESSEQPHLHFEVLKKDVNVDPLAYLPKNIEKAE
jgi:murein DD-endopeptidase MepM/ murein hydrolase activator NlpD